MMTICFLIPFLGSAKRGTQLNMRFWLFQAISGEMLNNHAYIIQWPIPGKSAAHPFYTQEN
jgi:hypothetical protein